MAKPLRAGGTRERLLEAARMRIAAKGFYGVSLAEIAAEVGTTKQTLLHHFGSKERLYAEVLQQIAVGFEGVLGDLEARIDDPVELLEASILEMFRSQQSAPQVTQIVMRELMDNEPRADRVGDWVLKPWLDRLADLVRKTPGGANLSRPQALAAVYQLLGAVTYLGVSQPTLSQMFGQRTWRQLERSYPEELRTLVRRRFGP